MNFVVPETTLDQTRAGDVLKVASVLAPASSPHWTGLLEDIGFLPGERVAVIARSAPGGDPLVVRVGLSTFALRLAEAACIRVVPLELNSA